MLIKRLIPLYMGALMGPMGGFGVVTLIPVLAQTWSIPFSSAALSITFYMIPFILVQLVSGSIAQAWNIRKTLMTGFTAYACGAILSGLSGNFPVFILFRVIQGIGAAFLNPIIMALIGELTPARHVGKAMGVLGLAYTAGITLGPGISGLIEVRYGWQGFFFFMASLSALTGILFHAWCGSIEVNRESPAAQGSIIILMKQAFNHAGLLTLSSAAFSLFLAYIGIMTFTADYMKSVAGLSSDRIGLLLAMTGASGLFFSPLAGILGDRCGRRAVFAGGMVLVFVALILMLGLEFKSLHFIGLFLLLGAGSALAWTSLNTMAVLSSSSLRAPVTSLYNAIKFSGYALSPPIMAIFYGWGRLPAVQTACLIAIIISFVLGVRKREQ